MTHENEYKKLSRISHLENRLSEFGSNYKNELIIKAGISVICDSNIKVISELNKIKETLKTEVDLLTNQIDEYNSRIKVLQADVIRSHINIKEDFISLREDTLAEIDSVSNMSELSNLIQKILGKDGYIIQERIDLIIKKHTESLFSECKNIFESLEESLIYHSKIQSELIGKLSGMSKKYVKGLLSAPTRKIADAILKTRNVLKLPFKFKPYGALKFAKFLKTMPVVMEALELFVDVWSKIKMDKKRNKIKSELEDSFKKLIQILTLDKYIETYFPFISKTLEILESLRESKLEINETISKVNVIVEELSIEKFF